MFTASLGPLSQRILPYDWQAEASAALANVLDPSTYVDSPREPKRGVLLTAGTGTGKMYMTCAAIRQLVERNALVRPPGSINPFPVLWLTPKSVKSQTVRVLAQYGLLSLVNVMSYSELRSGLGAMYIEWVDVAKMLAMADPGLARDADAASEMAEIPLWRHGMQPALLVADECQCLKNPKSLQSRVVRAAPAAIRALFASATPFQRCIDAQTLCERFSVMTKYNYVAASPSNSRRILMDIARPKDVNEYSPSAVERLRDALAPYVVELRNVRFKYQAHTRCISVDFRGDEQSRYNELVKQLIADLNARKKREENTAIFFLVAMQKLQQGAELLRVPRLVERAIEVAPTKAVIIASNFVDTLRGCHAELVKRGIDPSRIAIIMGGQSAEERQQMVDGFQSGKRDILLFTMRSGGVGISLHHDRKETKPRHIILPPTWSAIDLTQALGRAHRLTSLSATNQEVLWYNCEIENAVKARVELKMKCLRKAVVAKEQFMDVFADAINVRVDSDDISTAIESSRHPSADNATDDDLPDDDSESYTGEGLDEEDELVTTAAA